MMKMKDDRDKTSRSLEEKIALVRQRLAEKLGETGVHPASSLGVARIIERPFSSVVRLAVQGEEGGNTPSGPSFMMKSVTHHPVIRATTSAANQAVVEYEILAELHRAFAGLERCSVPRPVLVIPEIETYVMEYVEGELLVDLNRRTRYLSSWAAFERLLDLYALAGTWLRHLHRHTGVTEGPADALEAVVERCRTRLDLIGKSGSRLIPAGFPETVSGYIEQQRGLVERVPVTGRHGDFTPWNMLAGPRGLTVIDFMGYREDPLPVDIIKMLVFIEDESRSLTTSKTRTVLLRERFLSGYGTLPAVDRPVWNICEAMQRVVSIWSRLSNPPRLSHHRLERSLTVAAHVRWILERHG